MGRATAPGVLNPATLRRMTVSGGSLEGVTAVGREFGTLLKRQRRAAGLTQEELAERVDYSVSHIRKLEQGTRKPTAGALEDLVKALAVSDDVRVALQGACGPAEGIKRDTPGGRSEWREKLPAGLIRAAEQVLQAAVVGFSPSKSGLIAILSLFGLLVLSLLAIAVAAIVLAVHDLVLSSSSSTPLVLPRETVPGGIWVQPRNGASFARSVNFAAHIYSANPDGPPIKYAIFTAWWPEVGPGRWAKVCEVRRAVADDVYKCTWNFHWHSRRVAPGPVKISFDVYDTAGKRNLAPNGVHTIYYSPTG